MTNLWHGIKPTRLWHKTGKIHMRNMLRARFNARHGAEMDRFYNVRERHDLLTFVGLIFGNVLFANYLFGTFSPPNDCKKDKDKKDIDEDTSTCPGASDPCPPIQESPRPKPCPGR